LLLASEYFTCTRVLFAQAVIRATYWKRLALSPTNRPRAATVTRTGPAYSTLTYSGAPAWKVSPVRPSV